MAAYCVCVCVCGVQGEKRYVYTCIWFKSLTMVQSKSKCLTPFTEKSVADFRVRAFEHFRLRMRKYMLWKLYHKTINFHAYAHVKMFETDLKSTF